MFKYILIYLVISAQILSPTLAIAQDYTRLIDSDFGVSDDLRKVHPTSEFLFRNTSDDELISVYLLGAVKKPGLYHIPSKTHLLRLLALSGGNYDSADLSEISIARESEEAREINLKKTIHNGNFSQISLKSNDIIYVKPESKLFSDNTVVTVSLLSSVLGIILSAVLIKNQLSN